MSYVDPSESLRHEVVEPGIIVTFEQRYSTDKTDNWGGYMRTVIYPNNLDKPTVYAMKGLTVGASFKTEVSAFDNIEYDPTLVFRVPKEALLGVDKLELGMVFQTRCLFNSAYNLPAVVVGIGEQEVKLDCNQPLIGHKDIISHIVIRALQKPSSDELSDFIPVSKPLL